MSLLLSPAFQSSFAKLRSSSQSPFAHFTRTTPSGPSCPASYVVLLFPYTTGSHLDYPESWHPSWFSVMTRHSTHSTSFLHVNVELNRFSFSLFKYRVKRWNHHWKHSYQKSETTFWLSLHSQHVNRYGQRLHCRSATAEAAKEVQKDTDNNWVKKNWIGLLYGQQNIIFYKVRFSVKIERDKGEMKGEPHCA